MSDEELLAELKRLDAEINGLTDTSSRLKEQQLQERAAGLVPDIIARLERAKRIEKAAGVILACIRDGELRCAGVHLRASVDAKVCDLLEAMINARALSHPTQQGAQP